MMAEYAHAYGQPSADMPWPLFVSNLKRAPAFEARALLRQANATLWAIGQAFTKQNIEAEQFRRELEELAYPWKHLGDPFLIRGSDAGT